MFDDEHVNNMVQGKGNVCPLSTIQNVNIESYSKDEDHCHDFTTAPMFNQQGYYDIGDHVIECDYCGACMWYQE
ncbi:hypothetical protein Lal_00030141 [Lupinus albus]|nr:hypothetical protein Lal_00030141 [Lupinus albus]